MPCCRAPSFGGRKRLDALLRCLISVQCGRTGNGDNEISSTWHRSWERATQCNVSQKIGRSLDRFKSDPEVMVLTEHLSDEEKVGVIRLLGLPVTCSTLAPNDSNELETKCLTYRRSEVLESYRPSRNFPNNGQFEVRQCVRRKGLPDSLCGP